VANVEEHALEVNSGLIAYAMLTFASSTEPVNGVAGRDLAAKNKVDVAPPAWVAALRSAYPTAVPVWVLTGEGIEDLRAAIAAALGRL
jgi:50S ribosomal subunit-associated GTPase HflX